MPDSDDKKPRVGEILDVDLARRTRTTRLGNTNYEEGNPKWGTARFNRRMKMNLRMRDHDKQFTFMGDKFDEVSIGRKDPNTGEMPDVDLSAFDALNKGVSRQHAIISRGEGALTLVDLGTPNGTFLNGQKLVPNQPRILRDGDDIRLGHLAMRLSYLPIDAD